MSSIVQLDVWSDIACPWCFIGKRRLQRALASSGITAEVTWRAFELQPDLPPEGLPAPAFYARKFGSPARMQQIFEQMTTRGRDDQIAFAFDRMQRAPNTRLAHRAIKLARAAGGEAAQDAVVEALFRAHFSEGVDVADRDALLAALPAGAVDIEALRRRLAGDDGLDEVVADEELAARLGISGVPLFLAQRQLAVSGAQQAAVFERFLAKARDLA